MRININEIRRLLLRALINFLLFSEDLTQSLFTTLNIHTEFSSSPTGGPR